MQTSLPSTLSPERSRVALQKLRTAAESEANVMPSGVVSTVRGDINFDVNRSKLTKSTADPNNQFGAASYAGQNSEHIGNGPGGPQ
jgi:hypothetical protein